MPRTLYDDWKARRERMAQSSGRVGDHQAVEMRLLDYLLRRYRAAPEADRPARFPLPASVFVDHRAITVIHHLSQGQIPKINSRQEAVAHVRAIVDRMQSAPAKDTAAADEGGANLAAPLPVDPADAVRAELCDSDPAVRIRAAVELGEIGDLDDIGLLSDLLSLPANPDEHPRERAALLHAMQRLSGTTTRPFDLRGVRRMPKAEMEFEAEVESVDESVADTPARRRWRLVFHYVQPLLLIVYGTALILGGILLFLAVIGALSGWR